jgi:hypothetical protein
MAGLGPAIHVLFPGKDVDARDEPAHDGIGTTADHSTAVWMDG